MRTVSAQYEAAYRSKAAKDRDLIYMFVPRKEGETTDLEFWFCTDERITIGTQTYDPRITRFPAAIKHSLGKSPDGGDCALNNADRTLGLILGDPDRDVDNVILITARAYNVASSPDLPVIYEADPIARCYMRNVRIRREITFQMISDMSRRGGRVGAEPISQRCRFVFNVQGSHPLGASCGWQISQGGDPDFCNHDRADCIAHDNEHRYGGVDELKAEQNLLLTPSGLDPFGNGWPEGTHPRIPSQFDPDNPIILRRKYEPVID